MIRQTPLDMWLENRIGCGRGLLSQERLRHYHQKKLAATLQWAAEKSPFYRRLLPSWAAMGLETMDAWTALPFTTADDLRHQGPEFLCLSQSEICRVVTLDTSGTEGRPKRLYFTADEQETTVEFFAVGMSTLVDHGDRVLILLPGERLGGVGELLERALKKLGAIPIPHGPVQNLAKTLELMRVKAVNALVGIPTQVLALARYSLINAEPVRLKSVLLSTDHAAEALVQAIEKSWQCQVFDHYGMTEMGLGGGVDCEAHAGYHLRDADLYFEVVDTVTGELAQDGAEGEVVFTTLTRRGMPLIRYRTGDIARFLTEPCSCGSRLARLDYIRRRSGGGARSEMDCALTMAELDEWLFAVPGVIDFAATFDSRSKPAQLSISLLTIGEAAAERQAMQRLEMLPALHDLQVKKNISFDIQAILCDGSLPVPAGKRKINKMEDRCEK